MKVKLKMNEVNYLIVNGLVNGKKVPFFIDSGANHSVIDSKWANKLNLKLNKSDIRIGGYGESTLKTSTIKNLEIEFGGKVFKTSKALCVDMSNANKSLKREGAKPIAGLIGADILLKYKAVIDYDKMTMKFTV